MKIGLIIFHFCAKWLNNMKIHLGVFFSYNQVFLAYHLAHKLIHSWNQ